MIDHDVASYGHIAKLFVDGSPYGDLTRDDILDNITLSWLTNTGISSARLYLPAPRPALWLDPGRARAACCRLPRPAGCYAACGRWVRSSWNAGG